MVEQSWKNAIVTVLSESPEPLHYSEITERILTRGLKSTAGTIANSDERVSALAWCQLVFLNFILAIPCRI